MTRLVDLHPVWVGAGGEGIRNADGSPAPARTGIGVSFDCPDGCGKHCFIPFENPLDGGPPIHPVSAQWKRTGDTFETLTLRPSLQRLGGCRWHGYITNGEAKAV
jgi:hypothetical protein